MFRFIRKLWDLFWLWFDRTILTDDKDHARIAEGMVGYQGTTRSEVEKQTRLSFSPEELATVETQSSQQDLIDVEEMKPVRNMGFGERVICTAPNGERYWVYPKQPDEEQRYSHKTYEEFILQEYRRLGLEKRV
jgi:hypothetical protein